MSGIDGNTLDMWETKYKANYDVNDKQLSRRYEVAIYSYYESGHRNDRYVR